MYQPFREARVDAREAELIVAEHFGGVSIGDQGVSDSGDVIVQSWWIDHPVQQVIEVKWLDLDFTCLSDFPYNNIVFENLSTWNRKEHDVWIYTVCNRDLTHMATIDVMATVDYWTVRPNVQHKQGVHDCLQIPKQYALWSEINGNHRNSDNMRADTGRPDCRTQQQLP